MLKRSPGLVGHSAFAMYGAEQEQIDREEHFATDSETADREAVLKAVQRNWKAFLYASDDLKGDRQVVLEVLKQDGPPAHILPLSSEELRGDREIVLEAVTQDGVALQYASEELKGDRQ
eukprot:SAG31_NODE_18304_length_641_cov_0.710332_1_plen_118_part_10